jgi:hypothetical protein
MFNHNYEKEVEELISKIAEIRKSWELSDKAKSTGYIPQMENFGYDPTAIPSLSPCPVCGESKTKDHYITAACRHNGDAHGSRLEWCTNCGQCNHSKWDDH